MHEEALAGSTLREWREGRPVSASTFYISGGVSHRSMKFRGVEEAVSRSAILLHNECKAQASEAPIERAVLVDRVAHTKRGPKRKRQPRCSRPSLCHDIKTIT
jgi:hypothetical protein